MSEHGKCQELIAEMCEYVEGTLSADLCADFERHLKECEDCRVVVNTLRKTIELYQHTGELDEPLPGPVRERLFACLNIEDYLKSES